MSELKSRIAQAPWSRDAEKAARRSLRSSPWRSPVVAARGRRFEAHPGRTAPASRAPAEIAMGTAYGAIAARRTLTHRRLPWPVERPHFHRGCEPYVAGPPCPAPGGRADPADKSRGPAPTAVGVSGDSLRQG